MPMARIRPLTAAAVVLLLAATACVADDPAGFDETREQRLEETPVGGEEEGIETGPDRPETGDEADGEEAATDEAPADFAALVTLHGAPLPVSVDDGRVLVADAEVVEPDVDAANGVIHVIDAVLLPPEGDDPG
jgi:hypothetical protein